MSIAFETKRDPGFDRGSAARDNEPRPSGENVAAHTPAGKGLESLSGVNRDTFLKGDTKETTQETNVAKVPSENASPKAWGSSGLIGDIRQSWSNGNYVGSATRATLGALPIAIGSVGKVLSMPVNGVILEPTTSRGILMEKAAYHAVCAVVLMPFRAAAMLGAGYVIGKPIELLCHAVSEGVRGICGRV